MNRTCYRCGEEGHYAAWCPSLPPEPEQQAPVTCHVCGRPGHVAIACRLHPSRLRLIKGEACGPGPCATACRSGDHHNCAYDWCACTCHQMMNALP